jgi:hypothetical protein
VLAAVVMDPFAERNPHYQITLPDHPAADDALLLDCSNDRISAIRVVFPVLACSFPQHDKAPCPRGWRSGQGIDTPMPAGMRSRLQVEISPVGARRVLPLCHPSFATCAVVGRLSRGLIFSDDGYTVRGSIDDGVPERLVVGGARAGLAGRRKHETSPDKVEAEPQMPDGVPPPAPDPPRGPRSPPPLRQAPPATELSRRARRG